MLAYIFWHRPQPQVDRKRYEDAIVRFQRDLARRQPPGFIAARSFRIAPVPWLGDAPGYEDWSLLDGSWAMDPLNSVAVSDGVRPAHDGAAALMGEGCGGLYAHEYGEAVSAEESAIYWLTRPRGIQWQAALEPVRARCPQANVWRRQMVLGPAAEFAVEAPGETSIEVPPGWQARRVQRVRLKS